jgi:hypothetical protein
MRFMMLMVPNGRDDAKPGIPPDAEAVAAMMKYNEALQKAGVLLALEGLHPPSVGARVSFAEGKPEVTDGPLAGAKEMVGYWMIRVKSKEEAIAWAKRCPASSDGVLEIRQVHDLT